MDKKIDLFPEDEKRGANKVPLFPPTFNKKHFLHPTIPGITMYVILYDKSTVKKGKIDFCHNIYVSLPFRFESLTWKGFKEDVYCKKCGNKGCRSLKEIKRFFDLALDVRYFRFEKQRNILICHIK